MLTLHHSKLVGSIALFFTVLTTASCGGGSGLSASSVNGAPSETVRSLNKVTARAGYIRKGAHGNRLLYVSNYLGNDILAYPTKEGDASPVELITTGISQPAGIATSSNGDLYVANSGNNTVTVYHPGAIAPYFTINAGIYQPNDVAVDSNNTVYVSQDSGDSSLNSINEYQQGSNSQFQTIFEKSPVGLALDAANNLYVTDVGGYAGGMMYPPAIYVYPAGSTSGTIPGYSGLQRPLGICFTPKRGAFYVTDPGLTQIDKYKPTRLAPRLTIASLNAPEHCTFAFGGLYVANYNLDEVAVYTKGSGGFSQTGEYTQDLDGPVGVAISPVPVP